MTTRKPLDLDAITSVIADHARTRRACPRNANCSTCNNIANRLEADALALVAEVRALRAELTRTESALGHAKSGRAAAELVLENIQTVLDGATTQVKP